MYVCVFATEERKRLENVEQASTRDLGMVGIQASWEKRGRGDRMQSWKVHMDREKEWTG